MIRSLLTFLLLAGAAGAQEDPSVSGPVLGYIANAGELRPLFGIPGAVSWGPAVLSGIDAAAAGPKRDVAIACAAGHVELVRFDRPDERIPLFEGACTRIAFSHEGRAAVIYDAGAERLRVIKGLPDAPDASTEITWTGALGALALTDDGEHVLASSGEETLDILSDGSRLAIPGMGPAAAVALSGRTAWVAPSDQEALVEVELGAGPASIRSSLPEPAAALALSSDSRILAVVRRESGALSLWSRDTGERSEPAGSCAAVALEPLQGNAVFRLLTSVGASCILDADRDAPRVFILPGATQ